MKKEEQYNLDKLIKISVFDFDKDNYYNRNYEYRPFLAKKYFWQKDREEGFYGNSIFNSGDFKTERERLERLVTISY